MPRYSSAGDVPIDDEDMPILKPFPETFDKDEQGPETPESEDQELAASAAVKYAMARAGDILYNAPLLNKEM